MHSSYTTCGVHNLGNINAAGTYTDRNAAANDDVVVGLINVLYLGM